MNVWNFTGHLGRDAETRTISSGNSVTTFPVAVTYGRGDHKGTVWIECNLWGSRGETLRQHLVKGLKIAANGELSQRSWKNQHGEDRSILAVNVDQIDFVSPKRAADQGQGQSPRSDQSLDDEIPF